MINPNITDTLTIRAGNAYSTQSLLVAQVPPNTLQFLGPAYFQYLTHLPNISFERSPTGEYVVQDWAFQIPLLRFAPPYVVSACGGKEQRYLILGGLIAARRSGWLGFGCRPEQGGVRLWVDVAEYRPRLGTGVLYRHTQGRLHRWITRSFLRVVATTFTKDKSVQATEKLRVK